MLRQLRIPKEVDLSGWDDHKSEEVDDWRNEEGISSRWWCFSCSDSGYMASKRRWYQSEVSR